MKRTPLKRKTPLARPTKPIKKAKPGAAYAQMKQRTYVRTRSGGRCEFERGICGSTARAGLFNAWARCSNRGGETAHIYRRPKCGKARDLEFVVIDACHKCHADYDRYQKDVRVPLRYAIRAWDTIVDTEVRRYFSREEQDRIYRRAVGSLGDRPKEGLGIYAIMGIEYQEPRPAGGA